MAHFGVLSYRGAGHLNPMTALARRLVARGHRVTLFQHPALEQQARRQGVEFFPIDVSGPQGHSDDAPTQRSCSTTHSLTDFRSRLDRIACDMKGFLREYLRAIRATGVDTLLLGEISLTGPTVAEMLGLPYFVISTSIPHNFGWDDPLRLASHRSLFERRQNNLLQVSILRMGGPVRRILDSYRKQLGLAPLHTSTKQFPALAHITQWPRCLDFARSRLPNDFYYTGPFLDAAARIHVEFPWDRLDSRPLVYASMGTTGRSDPCIFHRIAEACSRLNLQLVIALGGRRDPTAFADLPGGPVVVANASQLELLERADLVITHAGPNTALEALLHGKPMLALPFTLDQPAVAAQLVRLGAAEALSTHARSAEEIQVALLRLRSDPRYSDAARCLQNQLARLNGLARAAHIIEAHLPSARATAAAEPAFDIELTTT
jgi:MGT family glycosyltransferase